MTDRATSGGTLPMACPFLALEEDRDRRSAVPDGRHRCYAEPSPQPRALTYQEAHCLSPAFPSCRSFMDWAARAAAEPVSGHAPGSGAPVTPLAPIPLADVPSTTSPDPPWTSPAAGGAAPPPDGGYPWAAPPPWVAQPEMRSTATLPDSARPPLDAERLGWTSSGTTTMLPPPPLDEESGEYPEWLATPRPGRVTGTFASRRSEPFTPAERSSEDTLPATPVVIRIGDAPEALDTPTDGTGMQADGGEEVPSRWLSTFLTEGPDVDPDDAPTVPATPTESAPPRPDEEPPATSRRGRPGVPVDADAPTDAARQARPAKRPRGSGEWDQPKGDGSHRDRRRLIPAALPPVALAAIVLFLGAGLLFLAPGFLAGPPPPTPAPTDVADPGGIAASARPGASLPPRATEPPSTEFETYVVKGGDTLIDIARRFAITKEALICANRQLRRNPDLLSIGQELQVPPEDWQCPSPPRPTKKP